MTLLRMKLKNQSKKSLKGKRRQKRLPREEVQLLQNLQSTMKKNRRNKIPNSEKSHRNLLLKTKSTEEKINRDPKAPESLAAD